MLTKNTILIPALLTACLFTITSCATAQTVTGARTSEPEFVAKLKPLLVEAMRSQRIPGAVVYVSDPKNGTWQAALGSGDLKGSPMLLDGYVRVGSVTKTFTAAAVLRLVDQGRIDLDRSIETYLPKVVPNGSNITVRQLLEMTAGLFNNTEDCVFNQELDMNPSPVVTPQQALATAFTHLPYFPPGRGYHYSNTNYIVLGLMLEKVTGAPLNKIYQDLLFAPLGMTHTYIPDVNEARLRRPHVQGYLYGTNVQSLNAYVAAVTGDFLNSAVLVRPGTEPDDATDWNPSYTWASGAAVSTLADLAIWAKAYGSGALLKPGTYKEQMQLIVGVNYGLGIAVGPSGFLGHDGAIPGFLTVAAYSPEHDATIVVVANSEIAPNALLKDALTGLKLATIIQETLYLVSKPFPTKDPKLEQYPMLVTTCAEVSNHRRYHSSPADSGGSSPIQ